MTSSSSHLTEHRPGKDAPQSSFLNALIKVAGVLIYGDDMGALLPPVPYSRYVLDVIESAVFHLGIPRQRKDLAVTMCSPNCSKAALKRSRDCSSHPFSETREKTWPKS